MEIPLHYDLTPEMVDLIAKIEVGKTILENVLISPRLSLDIRKQSLLKSSLFSAKIEGNKLEISGLEDLKRLKTDSLERMEVENILSALSFIDKNPGRQVDLDYVLHLHGMVMKKLISDSGSLRKVPSVIFNQSGFPVYVGPPPSQIPVLLQSLVSYINRKSNENVLIKASLVHMSFEKIHPFLDGNGRVGRLLLEAILLNGGYGFNRYLSIEETLNERKEEYYLYLDRNDATGLIEFILKVILTQVQGVIDTVNRKETSEDLLLPRRKEILEIIRDQRTVSLDALWRRFYRVSPRMIRYDLKKLEQSGYIIKLGTTRGAAYKIK